MKSFIALFGSQKTDVQVKTTLQIENKTNKESRKQNKDYSDKSTILTNLSLPQAPSEPSLPSHRATLRALTCRV